MADTLKVLGQSIPVSGTLTTLYTAPGSTSASCSTLVVCNQVNYCGSFRVSVAVAGAADTSSQYIYYDTYIAPNATFSATIGITLATTDVVRVYSSTGQLSFSLFGIEVI